MASCGKETKRSENWRARKQRALHGFPNQAFGGFSICKDIWGHKVTLKPSIFPNKVSENV
ncbi:hypothetical protein ROBYS_28300 [Roseobacter sp. OBYS 0001]|nr:hypothetical protein ROBYS_28300 [Roseobacter sp. OBYS 0001]